ncbi:hypothetical protein D3C79_1021720 [compost metagenome]
MCLLGHDKAAAQATDKALSGTHLEWALGIVFHLDAQLTLVQVDPTQVYAVFNIHCGACIECEYTAISERHAFAFASAAE